MFQVVVAAEIVDNGTDALIRKKFGDFNPISVHGNRCAEHLPSQAGTSAVVRINPLSQVLEKKELALSSMMSSKHSLTSCGFSTPRLRCRRMLATFCRIDDTPSPIEMSSETIGSVGI